MAGAYLEMQKDTDALAALNLGYKNKAINNNTDFPNNLIKNQY